jgi:hypothetical protein
MSRQLTQEIFREDCVGDSSGKHNYNIMSLDTNVCNISSEYFFITNNINYVLTELESNVEKYIQAANIFQNPAKFNQVSAAVNLLSSYWQKHEFSVHYPLNISVLYGDTTVSCPTVNQLNEKLISLARTFLNKNYPANSFENDTKANVLFFLYNVPVNPKDPKDLITSKTSPEFSYNVRHMYAEFIKQDVHLGNGKILRFANINKNWAFESALIGLTDSTKQPVFVQTQVPRIKPYRTSGTGRSKIDVTIAFDTLNFDLYYQIVQSGFYFAGISDITLTINSGVVLGSNSTDVAALTISGFSVGDTIEIINNGNIFGYGGAGGEGQDLGVAISNANNGKDGGTAILLRFPVKKILNNGIIAGGGGGGSGGLASYSNNNYLKDFYFANNRRDSRKYSNYVKPSIGGGGGGGGGAGYLGGAEGEAGAGNTTILTSDKVYLWTSQAAAKGGTAGNLTSSGVGGTGNTAGGSGGALGQKGTGTGPTASNGVSFPPFGGNPGNAIKGSNFLTAITTTIANSSNARGDVRGQIIA